MNETSNNPQDFRELKTITISDDAEEVKAIILDKDTHINYKSVSNPNEHCIQVVNGHWDICNQIGKILTLKEQ